MRKIRRGRAPIALDFSSSLVRALLPSRSLSTAENRDKWNVPVLPKNMQPICETLGWNCGACWRWDEDEQSLRCAETWSVESSEVSDFIALSKQYRFAPTSSAIIARVWRSGEPLWIEELSDEPGYQRALIAAQAGLHAVFTFPIWSGVEIYRVTEFYMA
jgi:hypothetical protein